MAGVILTTLAAAGGLFGSLILFILLMMMAPNSSAAQQRRLKILAWINLATTIACPWVGIWLATRGHPWWGSLIAGAPGLFVFGGMIWLTIQQVANQRPPRPKA